MATTIIERGASFGAPNRKQRQRGFSLIEVVISMAILTVGLVSLLGVFGLAMAATQTSQQDMIAKGLANEALESVVTARNTSQINWDDIQNTGSTNCPITNVSPCGIFADPSVPQPMYQAITTGAHAGILGTTDDIGQPIQQLHEPGPDGFYSSSDDVYIPLVGYKRTILISPLYDSNGVLLTSLRNVNVTIQYSTPQNPQKTYVLSSYISQYQ